MDKGQTMDKGMSKQVVNLNKINNFQDNEPHLNNINLNLNAYKL